MLNEESERVKWDDLLRQLASRFGVDISLTGKPYTMIYEEIASRSKAEEKDIKQFIVDKLTKASPNKFYDYLRDLNLDNYITTNYDLNLEKSFEVLGYVSENTNWEELYRIRTYVDVRRENEQKKIWHIHGDVYEPKSISLGLNHYCGTLGKMDRYFKGNYSYREKEGLDRTITINSNIQDKISGKKSYDGVSWIELFFNTDIHIIGLSLDYSETDLWWLFNRRSRPLNCNQKDLRNKIIYYDTVLNNEIDKSKAEAKRQLLESYNVEYRLYSVENKNWNDAYELIFQDIKSFISCDQI